MKRFYLALLLAFLPFLPLSAQTGSVTLGWDADLVHQVSGYKVYYGTQTGVYTNSINVGLNTEATLGNLVNGQQYFCVVTAYNASGLESGYSNELTFSYDSGDPSSGTLRVSKLTFGADQLVHFDVEGATPGRTAEIYASGDLKTWTLIGSYTLESGTLTIRDPEGEGAPQRFYKISIP